MRLGSFVEMPLLAKELIEQSVRPRTYVVRFLYAATLFTLALALFYGSVWGSSTTAGNLGQGRVLFHQLVSIQFWAIYLLVPALVCGAITIEKEQNSLSLLLLTTLSPASILFQKLGGRLVPVLSFLLLSFPLMAVAYSYGGVAEQHLWAAIVLLTASTIQVGALSLACSAYFPTTAGALVGSYLCALGITVTSVFDAHDWFDSSVAMGHGTTGGAVLVLGSALAAFALARRLIVSRAFTPPRNVLLGIFQYFDELANDANQITGGIILVHDHNQLPEQRPIAWRETAKRPLGTARYLFRVLTVLELPILFTCQLVRGGSRSASDAVSVLLFILWGVAAALVSMQSAGLISSERSRQTLDVLLTVPMTGRQIILEKYHGVRRLIMVLLVPFVTIFWFQDWWRNPSTWAYLGYSALTAAIYLPLLAWFSFWVGLKIRSQMRAIFCTLGVILVWTLAPLGIAYGFGEWLNAPAPRSVGWLSYVAASSPAVIIPAIESLGANRSARAAVLPWQLCAVNFTLHGLLLLYFRYRCLKHADKLLGRVATQPDRGKHVDSESAEC